ncbi:hypothetical protein TcG_10292 [Trypanosoma cruzi]|nr:hypothetical protein TcG_10292 [Trypanosoma cruzi]
MPVACRAVAGQSGISVARKPACWTAKPNWWWSQRDVVAERCAPSRRPEPSAAGKSATALRSINACVIAILGTHGALFLAGIPLLRRGGFCVGFMFFMRMLELCNAWLFILHFQLRNILVVGETVPYVCGQSPGIARLPVASRALVKCHFLRCRR